MVEPRVSVLIVAYNTRDLLLDCLSRFACEALAAGWQIIVVDNASGDGTAAAVAAGFPGVELLCSARNLGFGGGNNLGLARASGEVIVLLNSDVLASFVTLRGLVQALVEQPEVGALSAGLLTRAGEPQPFSYGDAPSLGYLLRRGTRALLRRDPLHRWDVAAPLAAEWVSAACVAVRAEAVRQVGPFDEGFFMYFEDVDWGLRLRRAGWGVIYDPCFPVTHLGGASQGAPRRIVPTYYRSLIRFHRKHYGWASALLLQVLLGGYVALLRLRTKG